MEAFVWNLKSIRIENGVLCLLAFLLIIVPAIWFSSGWLRFAMAALAVGTLAVAGFVAWSREKRAGISVDQNV